MANGDFSKTNFKETQFSKVKLVLSIDSFINTTDGVYLPLRFTLLVQTLMELTSQMGWLTGLTLMKDPSKAFIIFADSESIYHSTHIVLNAHTFAGAIFANAVLSGTSFDGANVEVCPCLDHVPSTLG